MAERCPGASALGMARLDDHCFMINQRGVGTIVPDPLSVAHGLLWHTSDEHIASLDGFEGLAAGRYTRESQFVVFGGFRVETFVYVARQNEPGPPRAGYLERVVGGARAAGLPADYVRELTSWFPSNPPERTTRTRPPEDRS